MSSTGFQIVRLALTGANVADAEIRFGGGLNVITGPSDTGKTFILQCIDHMCGASSPPHTVPEAAPYDTVEMQIKSRRDNREYTLRRALVGGATLLLTDGQETRTLAPRHKADSENTLSHFLLDLTDLVGKVVRKNQLGETRSLSFRDLAHLMIISEEEVIRTSSPVLTGQVINKTVEKSIFRLILSGQDDSAVVAVEDVSVSRTRISAKVELLHELIEQTEQQFAALGMDANLASLQEQLGRIETRQQEVNGQLAELSGSVAAAEGQRRDAWQQVRRVESRLDVLGGLSDRFTLLGRQYQSDLHRLEAIAEAGIRLGEMNEERCPVCGAPAEHHDGDHQGTSESLTTIASACATEAQKVRGLIQDLSVTLIDVAEEMDQLQQLKEQREATLAELRSAIDEQLKPRTQALLQDVRQMQTQREQVRRAIELLTRLDELRDMVAALTGDQTPAAQSATMSDVPHADVERFCREVERRLQAWQFPDVGRVTFDATTWDVVIGGRARTSHGKGVRAVTHAAFTLSIMGHCIRQNLPHPGVVVIDSPLVVYREPDTNEAGFSQDVKGTFFRDIANSFADSQVIILENEDVPNDVAEMHGATVIRFTGTNIGRWGFLAHD